MTRLGDQHKLTRKFSDVRRNFPKYLRPILPPTAVCAKRFRLYSLAHVHMPASKAKHLASIFRSVTKSKAAANCPKPKAAAAAATKKKKPFPSAKTTGDAFLKQYVSAINSSSTTSSFSGISSDVFNDAKFLNEFSSSNSDTSLLKPPSLADVVDESVKLGLKPGDDESGKQLSSEASNLLYDELDLDWDDESEDAEPLGKVLNLPWLSRMSNNDISLRRKQISRERKQKWVHKNTHNKRIDRLVVMCGKKLGPDATLKLFGRLGRETGLNEYNSLISLCIQKARDANDEEVALEEISKGYQLFKLMKEMGFKITETTYGKLLTYLIDFGMVEEFYFFLDLIKDENPDSLPRLVYYEMRLWISINSEEKIQELLRFAVADNIEYKYSIQENLLSALSEGDRKEDFLLLLKTFDITKVKSAEHRGNIFKSLGKLSLESFAVDFIQTLKKSDVGTETISMFICEYALSLPSLVVEDVIEKFKTLHSMLDMPPASVQYEKLIGYSCEFLKVNEALNLVKEMFEAGLVLSLDTFHSILKACEESCDYNLVYPIKSMICNHNLEPNTETFRLMINLLVRMKDFQGAYAMMNDLEKVNLTPTVHMYNAIMAGYFREKNTTSGRYVLKQMEKADVKPDAATFSYLISSSNCEEDIIKFYNELCNSGVQRTKFVFMALINGYAACGQSEKAKQVILDKRIPVKDLSQIKGVLVAALASHGELSDALEMHEGIRETGSNLQPKAIRCLIEHLESEGELDRLLQLLEEINDSPYWVDSCFKVISYCVRHEHLRPIVDLLKQLKNKFDSAELVTETLFDEVFCLVVEKEATDMQFGLSLLKAIKMELGVCPSRRSLDFLLTACVNAKDIKTSSLIWKEYETAGLPYNVLSYLRMYQVLLASGDQKSATKILRKMPKDDPHVSRVIEAYKRVYIKSPSFRSKEKKLKATVKALSGLFAQAEK